ncbi:MAG TPA: hypothetical protein VKM36_02110, partial [Balneolaceae bacterium]|nr:hypothetical protein [Balneolaceae bacterium]
MIHFKRSRALLSLFYISLLISCVNTLQAQEQFTFEDVLQFEDIKSPVLSADGEWVAYGVWPEIGDGEARTKSVDGNSQYVIERGQNPQISNNGGWAGAIVHPPYIDAENA